MNSTIRTASGRVVGAVADGVRSFLGIPYGVADRFAPPREPEAWVGEWDARSFGPSAWQPPTADVVVELFGGRHEVPMDEHCLVLNVWAPERVTEPLPVLVYLHGGGHGMGSGSCPSYSGHRVARRGDAVVVTVNHRLGAFGYLYLEELCGSEFATSGINGILDIVQALRWVRDNIAEVGGDPDRVLVYGESGGGSKTAALFAVPTSRGLFHSAAMLSTSIVRLRSRDEATELAERFLAELGVAPGASHELLAVPPARLVDAHLAVADLLSGFQPVLDGTWAVIDPVDAVATDRTDVPFVIGTTRDEYATFTLRAPSPSGADDGWIAEQLHGIVGDAVQLVAAYRALRPEASPQDLLVAIGTDARFRIPSIELAERRAAVPGAAPAWMYRFDWETAVPFLAGRAAHGTDTTFFSDNLDTASISREGPAREELAARMSSALVSLAARGIPAADGMPTWPPYDLSARSTMVLDVECRVVADPGGDTRRIWATDRHLADPIPEGVPR